RVGAPISGIVGWRLQAGLRSDPGLAALDRGIEQVREGRRDGGQLLAVRLGTRWPRRIARLLRRVGGFSHRPHMGEALGGGKGGVETFDLSFKPRAGDAGLRAIRRSGSETPSCRWL